MLENSFKRFLNLFMFACFAFCALDWLPYSLSSKILQASSLFVELANIMLYVLFLRVLYKAIVFSCNYLDCLIFSDPNKKSENPEITQ